MYTLIRQVHSGRFIRVGSGNNVKSLAYVANLVDAALYLWEKPAETAFEIFNYADKPDLNTRQLLSVIYRALGREPPGFYLPLRLALALTLPFDLMIRISGRNLPISTARIRKMSAETRFESDKILQAGFRPKMTLIEGIERMTRWYLSEGRHPIERHLPPPTLRSQALAGG
jgi:nucleoside-diphosphate-sugar epimerase